MIRFFEICFSIIFLIIFAPVYVIIGFLIFFYDGTPIIFMQNRVGKNGNEIKVLKFRSMVKNAELVLKEDKKLYEKYVKNGFKIPSNEDPRIMPFGNFLRKSSLDEIPQFFNVLIGNMSIVGPRPVVKKELTDLYKNDAHYYLSVKPGITGLWQVSGRSNIVGKERVKLDIKTIKNKSLFFDIQIILKTIFTVLKRSGAW